MSDGVDDCVGEVLGCQVAKLYIPICSPIHHLHWSSSMCNGRWNNCPFVVTNPL